MAKNPRLKPWLATVAGAFDSQPGRVYTYSMLGALLEQLRDGQHVPTSISLARFKQVLVEESHLREVMLQREGRPSGSGERPRFVWREASPLAIGLSLVSGSYLSHASAMYLHALTDQIPKTIYVNKEQTPKPRSRSQMTQPAIDRAFKSAPRTSKFAFHTQENRFVLLSGKQTGQLEVSQIESAAGEHLNTTRLERTLIDIVVRPAYAGGLREVLAAYVTARSRVSVSTLIATLRKLDYVYPYHQAIGFLMERAGYDEKYLSKVESLGVRWNFYLDYRISEPKFDERWRLYVPSWL